MRHEFTDVLRASTALQVAVFELGDESVHDNIAMPALEKCLAELNAAVKRLKKAIR
jgi:hypothetical protein